MLLLFFLLFQFSSIFAAEQTYQIFIGKQRTTNFSLALDFNRFYQVIGHGKQAFIWEQGGQSVFADNYWSEATAINDASYVVGMAAQPEIPGAWIGKAYVWHKDFGIRFLDDSPQHSYATGIL